MLFIYFSIFVKSKDRLKMEKSAVDVYRRGGCVLVIVAYSRLLTVSMALRGPACVVCMLGCCSTFFKPAILQPKGAFHSRRASVSTAWPCPTKMLMSVRRTGVSTKPCKLISSAKVSTPSRHLTRCPPRSVMDSSQLSACSNSA